jgi:hypothetical protein
MRCRSVWQQRTTPCPSRSPAVHFPHDTSSWGRAGGCHPRGR